jgi:DNA-binding transcriptional ArsR family regulator
MAADRPVHVTDPRVLRAMAHPLRTDIFYELYSRGSARAADLAVALDVPANRVSFHLRTLAKYGLIEEAPEEARDRRDRVWRPAGESLNWESREIESRPGGEAAMRVWRQHAHAWAHEVIDAYYAEPGPKDTGTSRVAHDAPMQLTKAEAEQAAAEVADVLLRWSKHGQDRVRAGDTEDRRLYLGLLTVQPYPERLRALAREAD